MSPIRVSSAFDSGNIEVVAIREAALDLRIRTDSGSEFLQWFYFRVSGGKGREVAVRLLNAGDAAYPKGWENYRVCVSADRRDWRRVETSYADGVLSFSVEPAFDTIYVAYFAPYSRERHLDLVAAMQGKPGVRHRVLGLSVEGRSMDCLDIGTGALSAWVIARQHPGESMAEWWMEGFLAALTSDTPQAAALREAARFHVVPNMNPDGSVKGNLRTNAVGANLNREWNVSTPERSPEVHCVKAAMDMSPPDICLDVHGDEALPYNFIAGCEGVPRFDANLKAQLDLFLAAYKRASPEFQTRYGYPVTPPGQANLALCTNYVAQTYGCLAMTLEMPFKDNADRPDPVRGWSPERAAALGRDVLPAFAEWASRR